MVHIYEPYTSHTWPTNLSFSHIHRETRLSRKRQTKKIEGKGRTSLFSRYIYHFGKCVEGARNEPPPPPRGLLLAAAAAAWGSICTKDRCRCPLRELASVLVGGCVSSLPYYLLSFASCVTLERCVCAMMGERERERERERKTLWEVSSRWIGCYTESVRVYKYIPTWTWTLWEIECIGRAFLPRFWVNGCRFGMSALPRGIWLRILFYAFFLFFILEMEMMARSRARLMLDGSCYTMFWVIDTCASAFSTNCTLRLSMDIAVICKRRVNFYESNGN